jgi:hypothetical protein
VRQARREHNRHEQFALLQHILSWRSAKLFDGHVPLAARADNFAIRMMGDQRGNGISSRR